MRGSPTTFMARCLRQYAPPSTQDDRLAHEQSAMALIDYRWDERETSRPESNHWQAFMDNWRGVPETKVSAPGQELHFQMALTMGTLSS